MSVVATMTNQSPFTYTFALTFVFSLGSSLMYLSEARFRLGIQEVDLATHGLHLEIVVGRGILRFVMGELDTLKGCDQVSSLINLLTCLKQPEEL